MLSAEIERLAHLNKTKTSEIDQFKVTIVQKDGQILELSKQEQKMFDYETRLAFLSQEVERQANQYKVKLAEVQKLQKEQLDNSALVGQIQQLEAELDKLSGILHTKEKDTQ